MFSSWLITTCNLFEIEKLEKTISQHVILILREQFARRGIPDIVISDNELQLSSTEFASFASKWNFNHVTSSPFISKDTVKPRMTSKSKETIKNGHFPEKMFTGTPKCSISGNGYELGTLFIWSTQNNPYLSLKAF